MSSDKIIAVFGATGSQGGSVVTTYLKEPCWKVRAITRNASSSKAKRLKSLGADVVQADLDDPASLVSAISGAYAVFAVSDFWGIYTNLESQLQGGLKIERPLNEMAKELETGQLKNAIDAAANSPSLERFIISTLPNVSELSGGKYTNVCHFDSKAKAESYAKCSHPALWLKTSVYQPGYFLINFINHPMGQPIKSTSGVVQFISNFDPNVKVPFIAHEEDTGPFVKSLLHDKPGKKLVGYRAWANMLEVAQAFEEATGYKSEPIQLPFGHLNYECSDEIRKEICENFAFANEFGLEGRNDPKLIYPKDLASPPKLDTLTNWLRKQDWSQFLEAEK